MVKISFFSTIPLQYLITVFTGLSKQPSKSVLIAKALYLLFIGISTNKDCLLINLDGQKQRLKEVFEIPINNKYTAFAIKTDLLGCFDNPVNTVIEYCKGIVEKNDILTIGESPLAIMQNRYISPQNLEYSLFSENKLYSKF